MKKICESINPQFVFSKISENLTDKPPKLIGSILEWLGEIITDLVKTGKSKYHHELKKSLPTGILDLLSIPGLGPKRAKVLYEKLKVKSISELQRACEENRLMKLDGFGEKSQSKILEGIKHHKKTEGYFLISQAVEESEKFVQYLKKSKEIIPPPAFAPKGHLSQKGLPSAEKADGGIIRIEVAGSLRRSKEIVHDIDVLISTKRPVPIHESFTSYPQVDQVLAKGETKSSVILKSGIQADLRTVTDQEFPYALHHFTGSKEHNVAMRTIAKRMGLKISEYGIFKGKRLISCKDEKDIF